MNNKLFIAGLDFGIADADLLELFTACGEVLSARVAVDRETGQSRGFGFVEMASDEEAQEAIRALDGQNLAGRKLVVNLAKSSGGGRA
jgi:RNA recognition motif-containing protein